MHLFVGAPFVPTPKHIVDAMLGLIEWKGDDVVVDLGAGDGRVLETIKKRHRSVTAIGYEIVPTVWLLGYLRALLTRSGITLHLGDMRCADVRQADVVVLYLFPQLMDQLAEKFDRELKPGTLVICHTFGFADRKPDAQTSVSRLGGIVNVYRYRWTSSTKKE